MQFRVGANRYCLAVGLAILLAGATGSSANAQIRYARGQEVAPTYEGWLKNADGSYTMYFGYLNRNSEEALHVPVGPDNNFDWGGEDQGQPTYFHPGRHWWVFSVVVPGDWPEDKRLVWTLTSRGRTNQAKGWLQGEWEIDRKLIIGNTGRDPFYRGGVSSANVDDNQPPVVTGSPPQTITLPDVAKVSVTASDDGIPEPIPDSRRPAGVRTRWFLYRGPAAVEIDPETTDPVYGQPVTSEAAVTFSEPGSYRLRALVMDGGVFSTHDVEVTVNPPGN